MDFRYILVYIAVNTFCFITASIIVSKFSLNVGSERDIIIFRKMVACYMVFLATEGFWAFGISNLLPISPTIYGLVKVFGTFFIPLMVYYWFTFALNRFGLEIDNKISKVLSVIPIILLAILYITSFITKQVFIINPDGTVSFGTGFAASGLVDNIYGFAIIINALIILFKGNLKVERKAYIIQIIFILICTIGGILDAVVENAPIMQLSICLSFVYLFINIQEPHIYNDSLTGLNNRRRTEIFLNDIFDGNNEDWHLFMIDVDNFKQANDTKGHVFGDTVLKLVAKSLSSATESYEKSIVSRWGGDEFVVIVKDNREDITEEISNKAQEEIDKNLLESNINYPIHLSFGHCKFNKEKTSSIKEFIETADKELYKTKRSKNVLR